MSVSMETRVASNNSTETNKTQKKRKASLELKIQEVALNSSNTSQTTDSKETDSQDKKIKKGTVGEIDVSVEKMASKQFEGWKIKLEGTPCGSIKFHPREDYVFKKHVTVDIKVSEPYQCRHIGRFALKKALSYSQYSFFVAFLKKSNIPSKKILTAVSFKEYAYPGSRQLCMVLKKK